MGKPDDLIVAVKDGDMAAVQKLIAKLQNSSKSKIGSSGKKLNINLLDANGLSALHYAAQANNLEAISLLLEHGATVDILDSRGLRPLHCAARHDRHQVVDLLVRRGSKVNEPTFEGDTPLHMAAENGHLDTVEMLLRHNGDPSSHNRSHKTALDVACEFGSDQVVERLIRSPQCSKLLKASGQSQHGFVDICRTTCLHLAAKNGHLVAMRLLLEAGVNINCCTIQGTSLHEAVVYGQAEAATFLLQNGIDASMPNTQNQTAYDLAVQCETLLGHEKLRLLLKEASGRLDCTPAIDRSSVTSPVIRFSDSTSSLIGRPDSTSSGISSSALAVAHRSYVNPQDSSHLAFNKGDQIVVTERHLSGMWKGYVSNSNNAMSYTSGQSTGYFPASEVVLQRELSDVNQRGSAVQQSTELLGRSLHHGGCGSSECRHTVHDASPYCVTVGIDQSFPLPPSPLIKPKSFISEDSSGDSGIDIRSLTSSNLSSPSSSSQLAGVTPLPGSQQKWKVPPPLGGSLTPGVDRTVEWLHHHQGPSPLTPSSSCNTPGGHRSASPMFNKDSPTGSNRSSTASSNSSGSSSGYLGSSSQVNGGSAALPGAVIGLGGNGGGCQHGAIVPPCSLRQHRLSDQSYESGVSSITSSSSRYSYLGTSSSSSGGSSHASLEESNHPGPAVSPTDGYSCSSHSDEAYNATSVYVNDLYQRGLKEAEILYAWLSELHLQECYQLFLHAGYDMSTISRMTPEDLTAIGITQPATRKRLTSEISRLHIHDGIPNFKPNSVLEWLQLLRLEAYYDALVRDGYDTLQKIMDIAWEDLEEIGLRKLGHQKKIILAIDRLKKLSSSERRVSTLDQSLTNDVSSSYGDSSRRVELTNSRPAQSRSPMPPVSMRLLRRTGSGESLDAARRTPCGSVTDREGSQRGTAVAEIMKLSAQQPRRPASARAEVVAIQVKNPLRTALPSRPISTDPSTGSLTYESFHGNPENDFYCLLGPDTAGFTAANRGSVTDGDATPTNDAGSLSADEAEISACTMSNCSSSNLTPKPRPKIAPKPDVRSRHASGDSPRDRTDGCISMIETANGGSLKRRSSCRGYNKLDGGHLANICGASIELCRASSCHSSAPTTPAHNTGLASPTSAHSVLHVATPPSPEPPDTSAGHFAMAQPSESCIVVASPQPPCHVKKPPPPPPPKRTNSVRDSRSKSEADSSDDYNDAAGPVVNQVDVNGGNYDCFSEDAANALDQVIERLQWRGDQTIRPQKCKSGKPPTPRSHNASQSPRSGACVPPSGGSDKLSRSDSNCSSCSTDSNTLPFANENIGTIKQKASGAGCRTSSDSGKNGVVAGRLKQPEQSTGKNGTAAHPVGSPAAVVGQKAPMQDKKPCRPVPAQKPQISQSSSNQMHPSSSPPTNHNTDDVFNDIDDMFHGLTQELDDMLTFQTS